MKVSRSRKTAFKEGDQIRLQQGDFHSARGRWTRDIFGTVDEREEELENLAILRRNLRNADKFLAKRSLKARRKNAEWDNSYLLGIN